MSIFISYAKQDFLTASKVYRDLHRFGFKAWIDSEKLLPGQNWKTEISKAIRASKYFLALLSQSSVNKTGYVQKELNEAIDTLDLIPPNQIYLIPARLDDCEPNHHRLNDLHWVDLFPSYRKGLNKILRVLESKTYFEEYPDEIYSEENTLYKLPESIGIEVLIEDKKSFRVLIAKGTEVPVSISIKIQVGDINQLSNFKLYTGNDDSTEANELIGFFDTRKFAMTHLKELHPELVVDVNNDGEVFISIQDIHEFRVRQNIGDVIVLPKSHL